MCTRMIARSSASAVYRRHPDRAFPRCGRFRQSRSNAASAATVSGPSLVIVTVYRKNHWFLWGDDWSGEYSAKTLTRSPRVTASEMNMRSLYVGLALEAD